MRASATGGDVGLAGAAGLGELGLAGAVALGGDEAATLGLGASLVDVEAISFEFLSSLMAVGDSSSMRATSVDLSRGISGGQCGNARKCSSLRQISTGDRQRKGPTIAVRVPLTADIGYDHIAR